ncbi:hypothetical protein SEA_JFLIX2_90 [Rhodococcus phage Jflix2]|nr:hypothetical protein SEA_JFLIX2_90 [Rhodococcus phage Jflix2]
MSKRSKHQKAEFPARRTTVIHDVDVEIPGVKPLIEQASSYSYAVVDQGLPPYSPLTQDEFVPTRVCTRREHELLQGRISNQRRELRHLNRAYRRRENENARRIAMLKDQLKISIRATTLRNQKIETQQAEIDELRRQLNVAQNGGRRKRTARWPRG